MAVVLGTLAAWLVVSMVFGLVVGWYARHLNLPVPRLAPKPMAPPKRGDVAEAPLSASGNPALTTPVGILPVAGQMADERHEAHEAMAGAQSC
jgi:hypothetical protein